MANFVLVHGAWHGGWIWKRVARRLRDEGHDVYTPTMTGLGERKHLLNAAINLSTHIQDIVNVIRFEKLSDVVLCGHSYAGMIISGVADQISERIASLFYLDAFVPEDGNSIFTLSPESIQLSRIKDAGRYGGLTVPPIPAEVFRVNEQDRAWIDEMCTPHPLATMIEAIRLQGNHLKVKSKTYVLASGWESGPFKQFYERIRKDSGWITRAIESGGHCAMGEGRPRIWHMIKPVLFAALVFAAPVCPVSAQDAKVSVDMIGIGGMSCSHWRSKQEHLLEGTVWIYGFWTGLNYVAAASDQTQAKIDVVAIVAEVEKTCAQQMSQTLAGAVWTTYLGSKR